MAAVTLRQVKEEPEVKAQIEQADRYTEAIGYTEHGFRHAELTANIAQNVMRRLGYADRDAELAAIAGYLHDMGNVVGREDHGIAAAILAKLVLQKAGMPPNEVAAVMNAIGGHEEEKGGVSSAIGAALILADKSDVHRSRVRNPDPATFDIHDRVNYAAERSFLNVEAQAKAITLELTIDTSISQVMEYFEIFLSRMMMCRRAAETLGCSFHLVINEAHLL